MERERGLTATELTIATAIVVLGAAVAAANATSRRIEANETTAVAALEAIRAAQERFKAALVVDLDADGVGEYGLMRELTRAMCARSDPLAAVCGGHADGPLLDGTFVHPVELRAYWWQSGPSSTVLRSGYLFDLRLPSESGGALAPEWEGSLSTQFGATPIGTDLAETNWSCCAWPESYGESGRRTFFTNQTGIVVSADFPGYSGTGYSENGYSGSYPDAGAAYLPDGGSGWITGELAVNATGRDGGYWTLVAPRTRGGRIRIAQPLRWYWWKHRPRSGRVVIESRRTATSVRERFVCRFGPIEGGAAYDIVLRNRLGSPEVTIGRARATPSGQLSFTFDSRRTPFPDGVTSLTDFARGGLDLVRERDPFLEHSFHWTLGSSDVDDAPLPVASSMADNEADAVSALREIAAAQEQFRATGKADADYDGLAEYGMFRELTGTYPVRTSSDGSITAGLLLNPPLLPSEFGRFNRYWEVSGSGYLFHMILPGHSGIGVVEVATGTLAAPINNDLAETTWCCYAWPKKYGVTGKRTYFINQEGAVTTTEATSYSGTWSLGTAATAGAAFRAGGPLTNITGQVALCTTGRDGYRWLPVTQRPDERASSVSGALTPTASDSAATGTFRIESTQSRTVTEESMSLRATGLDPTVAYRVVVTTENGVSRIDLGTTFQYAWAPDVTMFGRDFCEPPPGMGSLRSFGGGTVELLNGDTVVLRGAIPRFATPAGPNDAGASLDYRAHVELVPGPSLRLKRGNLDVRATVDATGTRQEMALSATTFDRLAERADVVAVAGGVETRLGTIRLEGDRGAGVLRLDTSRGDAIPGGSLSELAGQRVEVRDPTGAVLLTGTFPDVR